MQFRETIAGHSENHMKHIITLCEQSAQIFFVKADGTSSNHCALKGYIFNF
jgi:hypothetical protein